MAGFTQEDIKLAKEVQDKYGVPASLTLSQYAYESGYGTSALAKNNKNYFGMRNGSSGWQKFSSKRESFMAYGKLLSSDLYASKTKNAKNVKEYINAIAETYAPSSDGNNNYAGNVLQIIKENNLTQYDDKSKWGETDLSSDDTSDTASGSLGLVWWGDIVKVVFCIIMIALAVVFLGLAVTKGDAGKLTKKIKGGKKK